MRKVFLVMVATFSLAAFALPARARDVDRFIHGVPQQRVPGVGLLKLHGIRADDLLIGSPKYAHAKNALGDLSDRTGVDVVLVRPIALGWAFVEVRVHGSKQVPSEKDTQALLARLAKDQAVSAVSEDKWLRPLLTPNDPGLPQMWHFDVIGAAAAWDVTQGTTSQRIGVIDTGLVRAHEDVGSRAVGGFDFVSDVNAGNDGNGRDSEFNDPGDACGGPSSFHGTHVAGTIGAVANNGTGVVGLNWNAGLVIGRALGACGGDVVDIGEAAVWLAGGEVQNVPPVGDDKVSVMNLSLGSASACSSFEQDVVNFVDSQGVVFVSAAGNDGGGVGSPANCTGVVSVAAHDRNRSLTDYSSFGPEIEIVAPGGDLNFGQEGGVLSTVGPAADDYAFQQGTSMAAPHVAGAISLMQALDPTLTRVQIIALLQSTGTACSGCGTKRAMLLNAALNAIDPSNPPPPPPPPATTEDDLEENDSFNSAKPGVACGGNLALFAARGDQDWFLLETLPGQSIDIVITANNGDDLDLYAFDGPNNADVVALSETPTGNEGIHIDGDGSQLHVLVNPFETATTAYSMTVTCVGGIAPPIDPPTEPVGPDPGAIEDSSEDNDTIDAASEMFCDEEKALTARDDDLFVVAVRAGDTLGAQVTSAGLALTTVIMTLQGDVLAEGSDTVLARTDVLEAGNYIVKVSPVNGIGTYRLRAACQAPQLTSGSPTVTSGCSSSGSGAAPIAVALLALFTLRRRRFVGVDAATPSRHVTFLPWSRREARDLAARPPRVRRTRARAHSGAVARAVFAKRRRGRPRVGARSRRSRSYRRRPRRQPR